MQLVNILRGGTLLQDIPVDQGHWQQGLPHVSSHEITVPPGSALADLVGPSGVARVNSYHHQAVQDLGAGLRVTATCADVIEAVEALDAEIVGVQWHLEQMVDTDPTQRELFNRFLERAATTRTASRS
jgi:putative glutamine amidotransferase